MTVEVILDTGPLVAMLDGRDRHHTWAVEALRRVRPPALVCEPVLAEACFLVRRLRSGPDRVLQLLENQTLRIGLSLEEEVPALRKLMAKYADVPMSLADACLVRMAELHRDARVITIDSDFTRYRRHGRQAIPLVMPPSR
ncbi:MAG: PIN domain-containing protein [Myxococcaceae bacterium]